MSTEIESFTEVISANLTHDYLNEAQLEESQLSATPKPISQRVELQTEWGMSRTEVNNNR